MNLGGNITTEVAWRSPSGHEENFMVTYGFNTDGRIKKAFGVGDRASNDICALANDACILLSLLIGRYELSEIDGKLGEDRQGEKSGPPASVIGAIVKNAIEIERTNCEIWKSQYRRAISLPTMKGH
jgi:hypothetical protein